MDKPTTLKIDKFKRIQGAILIIGSKHYPIFKGINTVGRNKIAVINIKHLNVSQNQALIIIIDEIQHYISDLNSSNGTFLQNTKLIPFKLYELTNNAEIKFGDVGAVYKKILASNTTMHLQQTLDMTEMTQNMTQNFYASNTQLLENEKDHNYSNVNNLSNNPSSIHDTQTQVVDYPSVLPKTLTDSDSQVVQEQVIEESVNSDIHEAPTQVCCFSKPVTELNIHYVPTQVLNYSNVKNTNNSEKQQLNSEDKSSDSCTQIMTVEEREAISNRVNAGISEILVVKETEDLVSSNISEQNNSHENQKKVDKLTKNRINVIHDSQEPSTSGLGTSFKEYDESLLDTSALTHHNNIVLEESIMENNNSDNSIDFLDIENTQNEREVNRKSLTSPVNSETSAESDITLKSKRPVPKLPNTQTDDENDVESTQDMLKQPVKPIPKLPDTQIDSDYSVENTQDIGFKKKPLKPIIEDSDTEPEEENLKLQFENKETTVSDSDTDCEDLLISKASVTKTTSPGDVSDSDTDIETGKKCILDDTDCIPPTQDAFASALGYKPTKSSQLSTIQSSEESFKLGLTELMSFTQTDNDVNVEVNKTVNDADTESNLGKKETSAVDESNDQQKEENLLISNQMKGFVKKFTFKKKSANLDDSLTTILSTNTNSNRIENVGTENINEKDEVHCLQSTQKTKQLVSSEENGDVFAQPTQLLNSQVTDDDNVFLKPDTAVQPPQKTDDEIFLQPTQLLNSQVTDDDNVFLKPDTAVQPPQKTDDEIFLQPTQLLGSQETDTFSKPSAGLHPSQTRQHNLKSLDSCTQEIYSAATQIIQEKPGGICKDISMTQEDLYGQATQKIENIPVLPSTSTKQQEDVYMLATQQMTNFCADVTETQLELQFLNETIPIPTETDRPTNPLLRELDKNESQEVRNEKYISLTEEETKHSHVDPDFNTNYDKDKVITNQSEKTKESDSFVTEEVTNLSHVDSDLNTTDDKDKTGKHQSKKLSGNHSSVTEEDTATKHSRIDSNFNTTNDEDKVGNVQSDKMNESIETLSQIEAFIKKPLPPRKSARHLKSKEESATSTNKSSKGNAECLNRTNFVKKSLNSNDIKRPIEHEDNPETLSQIVAFVNESVSKCENQNSEKMKTTSSKDISENKIDGKSAPLKEENVSKQFSNESLQDSEEEIEKRDSSREIRSDIDQSFALLESKSSKIRRKPNNDPILDEIKVTVSSHRKSMSIAENDKTALVIPLKKSKRTILSVSESKVPTKMVRTRKSKLQSTIDDQTYTENIPSTVKASEQKCLPENSKIRKLSVSHEQSKTTRGRKRQENVKTDLFMPDGEVSNRRGAKTRKSKLSSVSVENENSGNSKSTSNVDKKRNDSTELLVEPTNLSSSNSKDIIKNIEESSEDDLGINITKRNRTKKRLIANSSEDTSDSPTPAKCKRSSRKINCITSEESSSNHSPETSRSNEFTTPRKSRNAPKIEALVNSVERSKRKLKPKVVFTMLDSPKLESYIKHLGGSVVDNVDSATVLMTQSVKRSQKLLVAVAQGKPICSPNWINDSIKESEFLDPWDYILVDEEAEKKWEFSLKESLLRAEKCKLLAGYFFQLMTNTATDVLKGAIEASGGKCVTKLVNKNQLDKFVIVASLENKTKYNKIKKQHPEITVIEPEAIFDGVLRQELRFSRHILI